MISLTRPLATKAGLSAAVLVCFLGAASVSAEPRTYASAGGLQVHTQTASVKTQVLNLSKGRSAVIDLPVDASDVFVSNPAVADAVLRTPRRIFVLGVANGQSDAIFFDGMGRQILNLSIIVDAPTDGLADAVQRLFPGTHVEVQSVNGHVVLSGIAHDAGESDQIGRLAASFAGSPDNVLNLMTIAGKDQVTLKVRIVEVNRSSIKQLGLSSSITYNDGTKSYSFGRPNTYGANGSYQGGKGLCYGQAKTATFDGSTTTTTTNGGTTTTVTNAGKLANGTSSDACLEAFEHAGLARTLAEPNLTAVSGESAKFLGRRRIPGADRRRRPGPGHNRVQALWRRPRLHAGRAFGRPHLAQDVDRGL
ncbi:MAG: pilus assembly protein N-terminal domain-containing protein [Asticcacaulis sp.]|nr:pilus assembly protein N-terminal domain-containing protein [Asticcacaulis sp.]